MNSGGSRSLPLGTRLARPVQRLWGSASKTISRHPFLLKTVTSGIGFGFGDVLFQLGTRRRPLDWRRTAAMGAAGLAVGGPVGYYFIMWMERNIMTSAPHSKLALTVKVTLDQVLGFALWHAALAAINEPHRQTCLQLVQPKTKPQPDAKLH
ncbi:hypothetical protein D9Q98_003139 [Chlorella vulgaris]|uniref:Uncharacterized protein n=1 Tax=Chlorella vulgaris TaxID=3077 RepID=A0A9D4YYQ7_CHLVU|nr:hypothetical protein D9Q98_003139 [Chlorella vulgaris]